MHFSTMEAWPEGFVGPLILWVPATERVEPPATEAVKPPALFCSYLGHLFPPPFFVLTFFKKKKKMCLQTKLSPKQTNSDLGSMWPSEIPGALLCKTLGRGPLSLLSCP